MANDQTLILVILLLTVAMFLWGRWRHDMVAAGSLLACVVAGLLPASEAFSGFRSSGGDIGGLRAGAQPRAADFGGR